MTPAIEVKNLWKIYGQRQKDALLAMQRDGLGQKEALARYNCGIGVADANFTVGKGEVFCVMGLSGSGKSTLVRLINRLIEPTSGLVLVEGEDVTTKDEKALLRLRTEKIGMVFQNFALMPHRTVAENVALPLEIKRVAKKQRREIAARVLSLVGLLAWANRFPHELSGGMQQRVGLARAMAGEPSILLMDEPFSALDPLIRRQLQKEFVDLSRLDRRTTIFITHDLEEAVRVGHRIAVMKDGVLVQIGTPKDIILNPINEYVADFVSGNSRLSVIYAVNIMDPIVLVEGQMPDLSQAPRVRHNDSLNHLIEMAAKTSGPIAVIDDARAIIGTVDHSSLLRGLQGRFQ
jgi:glycine betaine/proline transport system ATP-binding protein